MHAAAATRKTTAVIMMNTVEIKDHMIHVSDADCPDRICVDTGWIGGDRKSVPIVCLPNQLVIEFEKSSADGFAG